MPFRRCWSLASAVLMLCVPRLPAQELVVRVDPRVELVSALFRAGGRAEYRRGRVESWNRTLDALFARHASHEAVTVTTRLATRQNVGFFAPISLALHLRESPALEIAPGLATAPSLHRTWTTYPDSTAAFVSLLDVFRRDAAFDSLLRAEQPVIDSAIVRLRRLLVGTALPEWLRGFWRDSTLTRLTIAPGLSTGTANYGLDVVRPDGSREGFAVIGVSRVDSAGFPSFDATALLTVVHELNHPYVTAALRGAPPELRRVADSLHRGVATQMRALGYGSSDAMLNEALVRAAVIRYLAERVSAEAAEAEATAQREEGFVWIADVVAALEEYARDRASYPTFRAYVPRLIERLRAVAGREAPQG